MEEINEQMPQGSSSPVERPLATTPSYPTHSTCTTPLPRNIEKEKAKSAFWKNSIAADAAAYLGAGAFQCQLKHSVTATDNASLCSGKNQKRASHVLPAS